MKDAGNRTFEQLEDEIRMHYWREVRLTAEDLAARHDEGHLKTIADVVDEARQRAADHPWVNDTDRAQFILWCSGHAGAAAREGKRITVCGIVFWSQMARFAFYEDLLDSLVSHAKLDLSGVFACTDCSGRGYARFNADREDGGEIQRCDTCRRYASDEEARAAAARPELLA